MSESDFLYGLVPQIYRRRDEEQGYPLRALLSILQEPYDALQSDIAGLYDDWFVETCEPWVLPYLGDLVGLGHLARIDHPDVDMRALVANALAFRRRKGVAAALEQIVEAATGWAAKVADAEPRLSMTQTVRRPLAGRGGTVSMRDLSALDRLGGAFDEAARRPDMRTHGRGNFGRVGLFLWRLTSYPVSGATALPVKKLSGAFHLHPLGWDIPLFNRRLDRAGVDADAGERQIPARLMRGERQGDADPSVVLELSGPTSSAPAERLKQDEIAFADLADWRLPVGLDPAIRAVLDPKRGRVMLPHPNDRRRSLRSDHCYGRAGDLGGGPYPRSAPDTPQTPIEVRAGDDLGAAVAHWTAAGGNGAIELVDSATHTAPKGSEGWTIAFDGTNHRRLSLRAASRQRPCLSGGLTVTAGSAGGTLILEGLLIGGPIHLEGPVTLILDHCTLLPGARSPALVGAAAGGDALKVKISSSLVGAVRLPSDMAELTIADSIIDGGRAAAIAGPSGSGRGPRAIIERSTLFGVVRLRGMEAQDCLFLDPPDLAESSRNLLRHCHVPAGIGTSDVPVLVSRRAGHPGYGQLAPSCPSAILIGAANGSEFGAFNRLKNAARMRGLDEALAEYLPFGLDPIPVFMS